MPKRFLNVGDPICIVVGIFGARTLRYIRLAHVRPPCLPNLSSHFIAGEGEVSEHLLVRERYTHAFQGNGISMLPIRVDCNDILRGDTQCHVAHHIVHGVTKAYPEVRSRTST
jgi:hypothetical protein